MLINSLSALFAFTSLINPFEACIILALTFYIVYILTPKQNPHDNGTDNLTEIAANDNTNIYMYIQSAWLGRQSLLRTFLPFFIIFNSALFYADYRAENGTYTIASWLTLLVILALPMFWWTVAVWRCSTHVKRLWGCVARFFTIAVYYEYLLRIIIAYYYPNIWFNCQQLIIEFGDCV
ncbi:MAG: hypothetical protein GQ583_02380 [Methyloprofundus sp.]|nr:hypothetical protein [Methyloprofundus sp.]